MQKTDDTLVGLIIAVCLHAAVLLVFIFSDWLSRKAVLPEAKGEPVVASVMISAADIKRAQKSIRESEAAPPPKPAQAIQPKPEPNPQTSETPQQMQAQAPVIDPDNEDQERINKLAIQQTEEQIVAEREARRRQAQIDLTDDVKKQEQAENKQRLRAKTLAEYNATVLALAAQAKRTKMEEQRMQQLQDLNQSEPVRAPPGPPQATNGKPDALNDLRARYRAAIKATVESNWRRDGAQPSERCVIKFRQIKGGVVIDVAFINCPFSPEGRASAERALTMNDMPYSGFEDVFDPSPTITLCYPAEQCEK